MNLIPHTRPLSLLSALALVAVGLVLQVGAAPHAAADECRKAGSGMSRHQVCTDVHHEFLGSKFYRGETSYFNGKQPNVDASIYFAGKLRDKRKDGDCAWVQVKAFNVHWPRPRGNTFTKPAWKICGAGTEKTVGGMIDQAWTYPGTEVNLQLCQEFGADVVCSTFFKRTIPR